MSSASGIRAGKAYVELSSQDSMLRAGLDRARAMIAAFAKGSAALLASGTATLAGLGGLATMATDVGSAFKDASDRTGIAVEALSGLDYAARMSDTSLDSLVGGVFKLQKALGSVTDKKNPFKDLGLDAAALAAMKPDEAFIAVADALASMTNPTERNAAAMKVFGKGAADLIPLLASGAGGISGMVDEAKRLGLVMSTTDASELEELGDRIETLGMQIKRTFVEIGTAVAIAVKPYVNILSEALGEITNFVAQHRALAVTFGLAAGAMVVASAAVLGLISVFGIAGILIGGISTGIGVIGAAIGGLVTLVGTLATGFVSVIAAAAGIAPIAVLIIAGLLPIGLVLADLTDNFAFLSVAGQNALAYISSAFQTAKGIVTTTVGAMASALSNGRLALAGQIAATGLQLAFATAKVGIINLWADAMRAVAKLTVDGFTAALRVVGKAYNTLSELPTIQNTKLGALLTLAGVGSQAAANDLGNQATAAIDLSTAAFKSSQTDDLKKQIDELKGQLDTLKGEAEKPPETVGGPGPFNRPPPATQPTPDVDLSKFTPKVIGGFSNNQLSSQSQILGLADPMKALVAKADKTNELLDEIADNTDFNDDTYFD